MDLDYWHRQTKDELAFSDLLWSRPETKAARGKLLIIGGNSFGFAAPGEAFRYASEAGVGSTRVLLPLAVKKVAGAILPDVEFGASTSSGSFAQGALSEWLEQASWADGVLLAGDLGRNSETAILFENFFEKYSGQVTVTKDAAEYCLAIPKLVLKRTNTTLVITMAQLQKLGVAAKVQTPFTLGMDLLHLVDVLHDFTTQYPLNIIVKHLDQIVVAVQGQVSTTPYSEDMWRIKTAAYVSVWWLQNTMKVFEGITTAVGQLEA